MRTRIKFCGLVRPEDVDAAVALGVDAVGFVFYPRSPRFVDDALAASLRRRLPSYVAAVGLFVDEREERVREAAASVGLDVVQFHGDEDAARCERSCPPGVGWWRAVRMRTGAELADAFARFPAAEALLLDSWSEGYGGSGKRFDWSWIPARRPVPIVLSGGLDPENVADAVRSVRPMAVDVSSGIQGADPRTKDRAKMERFVAGVIGADAAAAAAFSAAGGTQQEDR